VTRPDAWFESFPDRLWVQRARRARDAEEAARIAKLLRLRRGQSALDVPCGRGRIAFHLARRGIEVVGVDANRRFIHSARTRFRHNALAGDFILGDMRGIDFEERFHAAYNWFGSFGYFSDRENAAFLRCLADAVRPGGRVLLEQVNREWLLRHFARRQDSPGLRVGGRWNPRNQRIEARWQYLDGRRWHQTRSSMRLYTPAQFGRLFDDAGLALEAIYDAKGELATRASRRLSFVGRKHRALGSQ
jgi:SAM-dependent methyltransferase